jgi:hypothetical protein
VIFDPATGQPTYDRLAREGEALRGRLASVGLAKTAMTDLVVDIHAWQAIGIAMVATQRSADAPAFLKAIELSRIRPGEWVPAPGWQARLDASLVEWLGLLAALDRTRPFPRGSWV